MPDRDHYGNEWRLTASGQLEVRTPDGECFVVWNRPEFLARSVATDDHGFVWLVAGSNVYFTNPRAVSDSEPPDGSAEQLGTAGIFTAIAPDLLSGKPTRVHRSEAGLIIVHCISEEGTEQMVELQVKGRDIGGPFTSGHTTEVAASLDLTPANADWEVLSARLPCGTHDNHCTTANSRVFLAGGATHHRGYPAVAHLYDELLACSPADEDACWVVVGRIPEGCLYSAIAALDDRVYVIGGGGGGRPLRDECWTFSAASISEATADRQAAPSLPSPRFGCVAATANGRIWVVGGTGGQKGRRPLQELLSISPGESEWRVEPPAPVELPVATLSGCELDGILYILGGSPARFMAFDTAYGEWDEDLPDHPLGSQASAMTAHCGEIWVCGGGVTINKEINPEGRGDKRIYSRKTHAFSVAERRWVEGPEMPFEQNWGAACSLDGRLMLIAGAHRSQSAGAYVFDNRVIALRQ
jgi:hypothetical protein